MSSKNVISVRQISWPSSNCGENYPSAERNIRHIFKFIKSNSRNITDFQSARWKHWKTSSDCRIIALIWL